METNNIHRHLNRQINKFLPQEFINDFPFVQSFIEVVNQSYLNYEKDSELFSKSIQLNDIEFNEINKKAKNDLKEKEVIHDRLIKSIKQLNFNKTIELNNDDEFSNLFQILENEIQFRKDFEEQLFVEKSKAEVANEAKSDFLSTMSHEIRTPLNAIIGMLHLMEKEKTFENFGENLNILKNSSQHLYLLVNDILDFNKIENGNIELESVSFNLKELVFEIVKTLEIKALENSNKIEIIIDDNFIPNIIGDPLRTSQILTNLIFNAIKFTENGLIKIKIDQIELKDNITSFKVQIIDNGIGIDKDNFNLIFEKFTQADSKTSRRYGGSGLGLVISRKLLNLFNSDIELTSEIGVGSNFSFILNVPVFSNNAETNDKIIYKDYQEQDLKGLKVLLVEDNMINIKIAEKILGSWNIEVDVALNGLIAVEKYKSNTYNLILMDLSMPIMDGYEATAIIRSTNSKIPIIALTASTSYSSLEKAKQIGINEYITKPFKPRELNMKLHKYYNLA